MASGVSKSIFVADDHAFTSAGLVAAIDGVGGLAVVGHARNGIEAIAGIKRHKPDCAVVDFIMPGANGIEVFFEGRRWSPDTRFAILTGSSSPAVFRDLIDNGVGGLFVKSMQPEEICDGIRRVAHGETVICDHAANALQQANEGEGLTGRELEVLHCISRGLSNIKIADRLGVSAKTVDTHRTNLMRKLNVRSTAALLVRAMRDGLIDISDDGRQAADLLQED